MIAAVVSSHVRFRRLASGAAEVRLGDGLQVVAECPERAPFSPDLAVLEEDTHRVLSAPPALSMRHGSIERALTQVRDAPPLTPGSIIRRRRTILAIVHDLSADPTCRPGWIAAALRAIAVEAAESGRLAMPLLGTVHGRVPLATSLVLTRAALTALARRAAPLRVWLVVPRDRIDAVADQLTTW